MVKKINQGTDKGNQPGTRDEEKKREKAAAPHLVPEGERTYKEKGEMENEPEVGKGTICQVENMDFPTLKVRSAPRRDSEEKKIKPPRERGKPYNIHTQSYDGGGTDACS